MKTAKYLAALTILIAAPFLIHYYIRAVGRQYDRRPGLASATVKSHRLTPQQMADARTAMAHKRAKLASKGPKRFDQPDQAYEFHFKQRVQPGQTELPIDHLYAELQNLRLRQADLNLRRGGGPLPGSIQGWTDLGPGNIGGRTRAIVFDPNDSSIMYASGVAGGIFKSVDGGSTWAAVDDLMLNLAVCALAIDPNNSNVIYAGTGEGFGNGVFRRGLGIFKSVDAGATWNQLPGTVSVSPSDAFYYVNKVVISPNDSNRIYAATRTGIWRSLDAGLNWSVVIRNPRYISSGSPASEGSWLGFTDLKVRTDRNPDVLFAAAGVTESDGFYRSDDGGDTWATYTTGDNQGRMTIAVAPSNNDVVYLTMANNGIVGQYGVLVSIFRSDDGGDNFYSPLDMDHPFSPWLMSYVSIATGCFDHPTVYSQGWYDNIIAVDPTDAEIVWVGGINLYRSDDGGQTFGLAGYWFNYLSNPPPDEYLHPDQHIIAFHPDYDGVTNQTMFMGNDGGLFRTDTSAATTGQEACPFCPDADPDCTLGQLVELTWNSANNGYAVTQFYHGDSAKEIDAYSGGTQDNGTSRVERADTPNSWDMIYGGDGGYVTIDPTNNQRMFVEYQGFPTFQRSLDGGQTFEAATNGITDNDGLFICPYEMDQQNPNVMWTGGNRPWRTTDGANSWQLVGPNFAGASQISAVGIAPSDSNVVYLGFTNGYVARTSDGLAASPTWSVFSTGLIGAWVSSVAVDPDDPDVAYCTFSNYGISHLLQTVDGGNNWASIDGSGATAIPNIPVHWVAIRPCDGSQLYVGTELGVLASDDTGATWDPVNVGLANTVVETLDFQSADKLVAFTHGRGAFLATLESCDCVTRDGDLNGDISIDLVDHAMAADCMYGPNVHTPPAGCSSCDFQNADLDADGNVDLGDFAELTVLITSN